MADELDDLFGAIDGDNDSETNEASKTKDEDTEMKSENESTEESKDAKKIYTSVMALPTASRIRDMQKVVSETKEEKIVIEEDKASTKDISTGTSHDKSVRSYSAYPKNLPDGHQIPKPKPSSKPAKEYPFQLDPFQAQAVGYIENEESVLVAAHTSAGKTAVAEYAIAKSLKNGQRVVYTSPIKALSSLSLLI